MKSTAPDSYTATAMLGTLLSLPSAGTVDNSRFFKGMAPGNKTMGLRMADIFELAKNQTSMSLGEVEKLLGSDYYEARMAAVSILDFKARDKKVTPEVREQLYTLYLRRHDRINNWDLVDRAAPHVVGGYLADKSREPLYRLAQSANIWERRTAIVATWYFIRANDTDDTFRLAEILIHDPEDLINKAVGSWIREAGKRAPEKLRTLLDRYAATMPRITLRYAVEKLDKREQTFYLSLAK